MKKNKHQNSYKSRSLLYLALFSVFIVGLWASNAKIYEVVQGSGRVIPQTKTQKVQHLEGGIIKEIYVKEGQYVKKDEPLFLVDSLVTNAEYNELMITKVFSEIKIQRLQAEKENKEIFVIDQNIDPKIYHSVQAERSLFNARRKGFLRRLSIIDEQVKQKELEITRLESESEKRAEELDIANKQLKINLRLRAKGVISETKLLNSQSQVKSLETKLTMADTQIPVVRSELIEARKEKERAADERLSEVLNELNNEKVLLERVDEQMKKLQDRLTRATVLSPSDGVVNSLYVPSAGAVLQPGAALLELTPTDGNVLIEGRIRATDRGNVWLGQSVIVRISAYDFTQYGALNGEVIDVSADSFVNDNSQSYYRIKIQLELPKEERGMKVMPGMTAEFYIRTGVKSVMQMILAPVMEELWFNLSPLQSYQNNL